jgi:general secretion pathway protein D
MALPNGYEQAAPSAIETVKESGNIRIIADEIKNSLVILATTAEYRMIEATLKKLDSMPLQVLIEVTIAEVTLNDDLQYGLQWFFNLTGDNGNRHDFGFSALGSGAVAAAFPGFSYLFTATDVQAVFNALAEITEVKVLSSPQLMVLDSQTARLQVGDQVPIATQSAVSITDADAPVVNTIQFRDTGIILEVTPRVNANGLVMLDVLQEVSNVVPTTTSQLNSPTIQQRSIKTSVAVQNGDLIALGGLIRDNQSEAVSGVPVLSAIPILGNLFKTTTTTNVRTELLVLIIPRVVRSPLDARGVTKDLRRRMSALDHLELRLGLPE